MPDSNLNMTRRRYRIYGLVVESEVVLPSVEPCMDDEGAAIRIVFGADEEFARRASGLRQDCEEWIRYTSLADGRGRQLQFVDRVARALPIHALAYRRDYAVFDEGLGVLRTVLGP